MHILSQGTERESGRHGLYQGRMGTCAFVEPIQLLKHKKKCLRSLGDTSRRSPIR